MTKNQNKKNYIDIYKLSTYEKKRFDMSIPKDKLKLNEYINSLKHTGTDYDIHLNGDFIGSWTFIVYTRR